METYKLTNSRNVNRLSDNAFIPFDPMNTDYMSFKIQVSEGAELQDATGTAMTASDASAYIETLP